MPVPTPSFGALRLLRRPGKVALRTLLLLLQLRKPAVALVNGIAVAGGLELMLACDFAIAAKSARIGDAHLVYGQMGGGGALSLFAGLRI